LRAVERGSFWEDARMNVQHGKQVRILTCVLAAVAVAFTWAGAAAPAWPAAQGRATGIRPAGAGDASAIGAARPAGSWGRAIEVPGLGALNKGGNAGVLSVSCASAGNCAAGGVYRDRRGHQQGFVASQRHGRWGTAIEVPGLGNAGVLSVSCASAGNCAAGGDYWVDRRGHVQGFVASQRHGRWGTAIEVPGSAALNAGGQAQVSSVSCPSAGDCVAGGYYTDADDEFQVFVASERNGTWGTAIRLRLIGSGYYPNGTGAIESVSCASVGNCAAGGSDSGPQPTFNDMSAFVVDAKNGHWGKVREVPGLAALNEGTPDLDSVSCASVGNCAAGGGYTDRSNNFQAFVVNEKNGTWGKAIKVPGLRALNTGGFADVYQVSCASPGNCAAGGGYTDRHHHSQGFAAVERNGRWGTAIEVPGLRALNTGGAAHVYSVSCAPAGTCAAGGSYRDRHGHHQGFVVSQTG
jgi:hypothetical protein